MGPNFHRGPKQTGKKKGKVSPLRDTAVQPAALRNSKLSKKWLVAMQVQDSIARKV